MTAQEFILAQIQRLKEPLLVDATKDDAAMLEYIYATMMSKKFRKFSVPDKNKAIIRSAIEKNIRNKEPIAVTFPFGGYKLWRLEETPEPDWAELFSMMYFIRWLKPVCAAYKPGVHFTFWVDEIMITRLNNVPQSDLDAYGESFQKVIDFAQSFAPSNFHFEVFLERSRYANDEEFEKELAVEVEKLRAARAQNPTPLSDAALRSIHMNVKLAPGQAGDPHWEEKVDLYHYAYYNLQSKNTRVRPAYDSEGVTAFTVFFEPNVIPIGTTKTSVAKFWAGVGALKRSESGHIETILSPSQLEKARFEFEQIKIDGLAGKNFSKIRILSESS